MKRVLVIADAYPPHAGTEASRVCELAKYLPERGWRRHVLCSDWSEETCPQFDAEFGGAIARDFVAARVPASSPGLTPARASPRRMIRFASRSP